MATLDHALDRPRGASARGSAPVVLGLLGVLALLVALNASIGGGPAAPSAARPAALPVAALGRLPLSFEPNRGQSAGAVRFLAQGPGYGIFLTRHRAVLGLEGGSRGEIRGAVLSLSFLGAGGDPAIRGDGRRGGATYFAGGGAAVRAPSFGGVRYAGLWPGIGMRFYGGQGHLEYDFDLAAGADPGAIGLRFAGQRALRLGAGGALLLRLGDRLVRQLPPHAFQTVGGVRRAVASRYTLSPHGRVGVALGRYDHARPLTIDPRLVYSTYIGRSIIGWATSVAAGADGSAYVTGATPSTRFPTTSGRHRTWKRRRMAWVAKIDPGANRIVYSTYLGGASGSQGEAIAVDAAGDAYVAGTAGSTDFPHTHGAFMPKRAGAHGVFVAKLGARGRHLIYSAYLGRADGGSGAVAGIAVDPAGNAYLAGMTTARQFPTTAGALEPTDPRHKSIEDAGFVAKLNRTGSRLLYSTFLSGSGGSHDPIGGLTVDRSGHAYVTGWSQSQNFPTTRGAFETRLKSQFRDGRFPSGVFVTKLNRAGSGLAYSTFISGGQNEEGTAIAVDSRGRAYITGSSESRRYPTTRGVYQPNRVGSRDIIVSVLSPDGHRLLASTFLGARSRHGVASEGTGIGLEPDGDVVVAATTNSAGFRTTPNALQPKSHSPWRDNSVIAELTPNLRRLPYLSYFSGRSVTHIRSLAIAPGGGVLVVGGSNPGLKLTGRHLPFFKDPQTRNHPNAFLSQFGL